MDEIFLVLKENGEAWLIHEWINPETKQIGYKSSWLKLHDGKIFGAGYFI